MAESLYNYYGYERSNKTLIHSDRAVTMYLVNSWQLASIRDLTPRLSTILKLLKCKCIAS